MVVSPHEVEPFHYSELLHLPRACYGPDILGGELTGSHPGRYWRGEEVSLTLSEARVEARVVGSVMEV